MGTENVRDDEELRGLVLQAFENITDLSDRVGQEYLTPLFDIFNIMYPVLDEARNNPPENASENMLKLLQDAEQEDEGLEDNSSDNNGGDDDNGDADDNSEEDSNSDDESGSDDDNSDSDSDSDDDDDGTATKR